MFEGADHLQEPHFDDDDVFYWKESNMWLQLVQRDSKKQEIYAYEAIVQ